MLCNSYPAIDASGVGHGKDRGSSAHSGVCSAIPKRSLRLEMTHLPQPLPLHPLRSNRLSAPTHCLIFKLRDGLVPRFCTTNHCLIITGRVFEAGHCAIPCASPIPNQCLLYTNENSHHQEKSAYPLPISQRAANKNVKQPHFGRPILPFVNRLKIMRHAARRLSASGCRRVQDNACGGSECLGKVRLSHAGACVLDPIPEACLLLVLSPCRSVRDALVVCGHWPCCTSCEKEIFRW